MSEAVEWRPVPGVNCLASNTGLIQFLGRTKTTSAGCLNKRGYLVVTVFGVQHRVNRLVCAAFHGLPPTPAHQAAHLNGDRWNNRQENLAWKTPQENTDDKILHNSISRGEKHSSSKLSDEHVADIKARLASGERVAYIHKLYPWVTNSCIAQIKHGRSRR